MGVEGTFASEYGWHTSRRIFWRKTYPDLTNMAAGRSSSRRCIGGHRPMMDQLMRHGLRLWRLGTEACSTSASATSIGWSSRCRCKLLNRQVYMLSSTPLSYTCRQLPPVLLLHAYPLSLAASTTSTASSACPHDTPCHIHPVTRCHRLLPAVVLSKVSTVPHPYPECVLPLRRRR